MRLDHLMVTLSLGSRKEVQKSIRAGRIRVNDKICKDPANQIISTDSVDYDGNRLDTRLQRHVMMNKPAGLLTAARDRKQPTVMGLLPPEFTTLGCMPCGRLDKDTEGLLLLTTDGELAHRLLAPGRHVDKRYQARVIGRLTEAEETAFAEGMDLGDFVTAPAQLTILRAEDQESLAQVVVHEGKFHQVKRMFEKTGHPVVALKREQFGPLALDPLLPPGAWRELTKEETDCLYTAAALKHVTDVF